MKQSAALEWLLGFMLAPERSLTRDIKSKAAIKTALRDLLLVNRHTTADSTRVGRIVDEAQRVGVGARLYDAVMHATLIHTAFVLAPPGRQRRQAERQDALAQLDRGLSDVLVGLDRLAVLEHPASELGAHDPDGSALPAGLNAEFLKRCALLRDECRKIAKRATSPKRKPHRPAYGRSRLVAKVCDMGLSRSDARFIAARVAAPPDERDTRPEFRALLKRLKAARP
jgi:hypothetical protein